MKKYLIAFVLISTFYSFVFHKSLIQVESDYREFRCGCKKGIDTFNIVIYDTNILNEYIGFALIEFTLNSIAADSIELIDVKIVGIQLQDINTKEIIMTLKDNKDSLFKLYENKLLLILKGYKCWFIKNDIDKTFCHRVLAFYPLNVSNSPHK